MADETSEGTERLDSEVAIFERLSSGRSDSGLQLSALRFFIALSSTALLLLRLLQLGDPCIVASSAALTADVAAAA